MTTEVLTQALQAGVPAFFGQGKVWLLKTATDPVTIICTKKGTSASVRSFINIPAGFKFKSAPGENFDIVQMTSATNQTIEFVLSDDDIESVGAVSILGTVDVLIVGAASITDNAPISAPNAAQTNILPQNSNRVRGRVALQSDAGIAPATVFIRKRGGAENLIEMIPGIVYPIDNVDGCDVRNDSGAAVTVYIFEENKV